MGVREGRDIRRGTLWWSRTRIGRIVATKSPSSGSHDGLLKGEAKCINKARVVAVGALGGSKCCKRLSSLKVGQLETGAAVSRGKVGQVGSLERVAWRPPGGPAIR